MTTPSFRSLIGLAALLAVVPACGGGGGGGGGAGQETAWSDAGAEAAPDGTEPAAGPPACALLSDGERRPAPPLALPAYDPADPRSTSVVDPVFGTRIVRVTGDPGDAIPGTGATWRTDAPFAGPVYAKDPPWNADQSVLAIKAGVSAQTLFVDGSTYVPLYARWNTKPEYRWHPTNPRVMIYVDGSGKAGWFDPAQDTYEDRFDPGAGFHGCTLGNYEGNVSNDGRRIVITCLADGASGDAAHVFFAADLETGVKYPTLRAVDLGFSGSRTGDGKPLDWATISPLGGYIVATQDWQEQRALTLDGRVVSRWGAMGHYDLGLDAQGNEVAYSGGGPVVWRLADGSGVELPWAGSVAYHSSTRNSRAPGWAVSSLEGSGGPLDGEIVAHELTAGGRIRRIAHHRATNAAYERAAFAAVSPDGTRVFFRSDWGDPSGPGYGFVVDVREVCP